MAVAVSRDLTVQVLEDVNVVKLSDRQQALRAAIQKGEPKCLGVSQVMLGLMVICYSIPLHLTEVTEVILLGVPWWSGLTFITAGATGIILDKHGTMKTLRVCLLVSLVSAVLSFVAVIIYSVDMDKNPAVSCTKTLHNNCNEKYYAVKMSRGVKSSLLLFTLAQMVISSIVCFLLFRQRRSFGQYTSLSQATPSTLMSVSPPDLN
ncbi:transmembrane protein 176 isoform X2 [Halichoeres trimaculatus]|uniref:transmembrane protein 176 isoform X2 n=1 Tax=Halichoeres trimaculatus TaxID=147232 RepID=UPI003D9EE1CB